MSGWRARLRGGRGKVKVVPSVGDLEFRLFLSRGRAERKKRERKKSSRGPLRRSRKRPNLHRAELGIDHSTVLGTLSFWSCNGA